MFPNTHIQKIFIEHGKKLLKAREKLWWLYKRYDDNMKKRENLIKELENEEKLVSHVIQTCDPLYRFLYSNG